MRMGALFGHALALQAVGRGRGSRALLRGAAAKRAVMHDASYWACLQLVGPEDAVAAAAASVR